MHHRVKNNLQIVSSLLSIHARTVPVELRGHFEESLQRIQAMGLLHEKFYRGLHVETVDLTGYLQELVDAVIGAFGVEDRVTGRVKGPPIHFNLDTGTPLALLAAEVISNACKHAFPGGRQGEIAITVQEAGERVHLRIADDGVGADSAGGAAGKGGMGQRLITNFVQQLNGTSKYDARREGGTVFELTCPLHRSIGRHKPSLNERRDHPEAQAQFIEVKLHTGFALHAQNTLKQRRAETLL